jgi:hypothetical protein
MRLLIITLAAAAAALGTSFGLQLLYPTDTSAEADVTTQLVTAEEILERPLEPAPLPKGRLLMRADETEIDVTPPEQGQLSEDMEAPESSVAESDESDEDGRDSLTDDAMRLAALAEEDDAEDDAQAPSQATADKTSETAETAETAETDKVADSKPKAEEEEKAPVEVAQADASAKKPDPTPTVSKTPTKPPAPRQSPTPTATAKPAPATPTPPQAPVENAVPDGPPGGAATLSSGRPLSTHNIASSSHDIDARSRPTAPPATAVPRRAATPQPTPPPRAAAASPAPTAVASAARRPAPTAPPASPQAEEVEPSAWWVRATTPEQLGVVHIGTAAFNRAIVMILDGGFSSVRSLASNVEVLRGGIVVEGQWSISPANDHLLIFPLVNAGDYDITVGAGLQDRNGRLWPHTVRGTISVP